jgi:hypothetical protein
MNDYGFYITHLLLKGEGKPDSTLEFENGLNVISGASNTGKTFIFECINFVLGAQDKPKKIYESDGYTEVLLEIRTRQKKTLTIKRNLTDSKMYYYNCAIKDINRNAPFEIKNKHDKEDENNISTLLLNICNANYKNVLKNKKGHTVSFSYRDFAHLTMISEQEIISQFSPIYFYGGNTIRKTRSKSVFKTIMTGNDDSLFKDVKENENSKEKIKGQIEIIDQLILDIRLEKSKLESEIQEYIQNDNLISKDITDLKSKINGNREKMKKLEEERNTIWRESLKVKNEELLLEELKKRFILLKKNYDSDLERLEFIDESEYYLNQLIDVKCPVCNSTWGSENSKINTDKLFITIEAEREKIQLQLSDLLSTIQDIDLKLENKSNQILNLSDKIKELDIMINEELKPTISHYLTELEKLLKIRDYNKENDYNNERLTKLMETKNRLIDSVSTDSIDNPINQEISDIIYNTFCNIVKDILLGWKFDDNIEVGFNKKDMDLIINNRIKKSFGKGYSAIINSAFVLAIMQYAVKYNLPHPKVVVLDSPLTTYKERDSINQNEAISDIVKQSFYKYLSTLKDMQIIILDNIDPSKDIQDKINYYHFTGNDTLENGRCGFIPNI